MTQGKLLAPIHIVRLCPTSALTSWPVAASQSRTVPSPQFVANIRPLGLKAAHVLERWPRVSIVHDRSPLIGAGFATSAILLIGSPCSKSTGCGSMSISATSGRGSGLSGFQPKSAPGLLSAPFVSVFDGTLSLRLGAVPTRALNSDGARSSSTPSDFWMT